MQDQIDSEEFEGWKAWFRSSKGARTPEDEINDLMIARLRADQINISGASKFPAEPRELMIFRPPVTDEEIQGRIEAAKAKLKGYLSAVKRRKR